jgi:hypothetical protein
MHQGRFGVGWIANKSLAEKSGWLIARAGLIAALATLVGCANVAPTQRGTLAKPEMQWGFDRAAEAISGHTYASKEAASGGKAVGGGGCGCT